jgi:hypothetical protein
MLRNLLNLPVGPSTVRISGTSLTGFVDLTIMDADLNNGMRGCDVDEGSLNRKLMETAGEGKSLF